MTNPACLKCTSVRNSPNDCICNNERRCDECNDCSWCIDIHQDGHCVPSEEYNQNNCPYSFLTKPEDAKFSQQEYSSDDIELNSPEPIIFNLFNENYFVILTLFYLLFINDIFVNFPSN